MPILNEFSFPSCDCKNTIYVRQWLPDGQPIGVVQLCHGIAEHISRYDDFAQYLASNGFVVAGNDHLGHGLSAAPGAETLYFGAHDGWAGGFAMGGNRAGNEAALAASDTVLDTSLAAWHPAR